MKLESGGEGLPGLAHAFRPADGGAWTRAETVATTQGADYSPGWRATEASRTLGPRSIDLLAAHIQGVAVRTSGPYLLVSAQDVGAHPRLYDTRKRERAFGSDTARAAVFWPGPDEGRSRQVLKRAPPPCSPRWRWRRGDAAAEAIHESCLFWPLALSSEVGDS